MHQAIISLKPRYVELILSGDKTVELRNRVVRLKPGTSIWIYATQPLGSIVGMAKVESIVHGNPAEIWDRYGKEICMEKTHFDYYIGNRKQVSALVLSSVRKLEDFVTLASIREVLGNFHPPQFYAHILPDDGLFGTLNELAIDPDSRRRRLSG